MEESRRLTAPVQVSVQEFSPADFRVRNYPKERKPLALGSTADFPKARRQERSRRLGQRNTREACGDCFRRSEGPGPRLWRGPSILLCVFHPDASTVADPYFWVVAAILNLDEIEEAGAAREQYQCFSRDPGLYAEIKKRVANFIQLKVRKMLYRVVVLTR